MTSQEKDKFICEKLGEFRDEVFRRLVEKGGAGGGGRVSAII